MSTPQRARTLGTVGPRRHHELDSAVDLRDVGGYRGHGGATVRWGALFRSDSLVAVTDRDRARLSALGLRVVVDLRTAQEVEALPSWPTGEADEVECYHHPVRRSTWAERGLGPATDGTDAAAQFLADRAVEALHEGAGAIGSVLALLSDRDCLPLLVHSTHGKDRTAVVVAVVLALLGVDDAVIAHDHGLCRVAATTRLERLARGGPAGHRELLSLPAWQLDAPPSVVRHLLVELRRQWGSVEAYADSLYVDERAVARVRANLLTPG